MEITGKIIAALPEVSGVSARGEWKSQTYVIETQEQYPKKLAFDVFGADRIDQFGLQVGDIATVHFDVDAREYNGRWFNSVRAWNVTKSGQNVAQSGQQSIQQPMFNNTANPQAPQPTVNAARPQVVTQAPPQQVPPQQVPQQQQLFGAGVQGAQSVPPFPPTPQVINPDSNGLPF